MRKLIGLLFNIHNGEGSKAMLFISLALLWGVGSYGSLTLSEGLFLENNSVSSLPSVYLYTSLFICITSIMMMVFLSKKLLNAMTAFIYPIIVLILANTALLLCMNYLPGTHSNTYFFIYRIISWSTTVSSFASFWNFVDQFFNLQDGKRFFCIFNASIFLGDALGSGLISFFIRMCGTNFLLIIFIATLSASIPITIYTSRRLKHLSNEHISFTDSEQKTSIKQFLSTFLSSKFTIYLVIFYFLMQLLAIFAEYSSLQVFEGVFANSTQEFSLTKFYSTCCFYISLGNMIFALTAYSRIIKKIGINNIIIVAPTCFLVIFLFWFKEPTFLIAILGLVAREGITYAIDDNNLQLLIAGVPNKIRNQVRLSIESFIEPLGMLICSTICFITPHQNNIVHALLLSIIAMFVVFALRFQYSKAIIINLSTNAIQFYNKLSDWITNLPKKEQKKIELQCILSIQSADENKKLFVFEYLAKLGNRKYLPLLISQMNKFSIKGKISALLILQDSEFASELATIDLMKKWHKKIHNPRIQNIIRTNLYKHKNAWVNASESDMISSNPPLQAAAIYNLKNSSNNTLQSQATALFNHLLNSEDESELCTAINVIILEKNVENINLILPLLSNEKDSVQIAASEALLVSIHHLVQKHTKSIINALNKASHPQARLNILSSIGKILDKHSLENLLNIAHKTSSKENKILEQLIADIGHPIIQIVLDTFKSRVKPYQTRILCAKVLKRLNTSLLKKHTISNLYQEIQIALHDKYYIIQLTNEQESEKTRFIIDFLQNHYESSINFICKILTIAGSKIDPDIIIESLHSMNSKTKAHAIETIEKSDFGKTFNKIKPLLENDQIAFFKIINKNLSLSLEETIKIILNTTLNNTCIINKATSLLNII